jgi:Ca2+-binding RTX toxin-like protein
VRPRSANRALLPIRKIPKKFAAAAANVNRFAAAFRLWLMSGSERPAPAWRAPRPDHRHQGRDDMPQTPVTDYTKVNTTLPGAQFAPAVTALSGGGYIIVWQDFSAGSVYGQRYSASGQPVGTELHLNSTQGGSPTWVSVAATVGDGFVITFQAGSFANAEIYAQRYDGANSPSSALFAVNTTSPNEQFNPHVTALDNGALLFTWDTQAFDVYQEVRGRIYTSDGQALGNDFSIAPMSATIRNGLSAITSLPGGGFVVTWQQAANGGDNYEIVGQRFTSNGTATGAEFTVNTQTTNNQYGNDVARLSDGGFVVTWVDPVPNSGGGRIVARHYDASGNATSGEIVVDTKASGAYGRTVVTALADGGYVVAWPDAENTNVDHNVSARAFGANDVPLGDAFDMSFNSPFGANFFSDGAVTLANGNVVFTWDGPSITPPGGQGTGEDVYMRVYQIGSSTGPAPIVGTPGSDVLDGTIGAQADVLSGLGGDDTYFVDNPGDQVIEAVGGGNDLVASTTSYLLNAGAEVEILSTTNSGGNATTALTGNEFGQTIIGNAGDNFLNGGGGADILQGLGGNDIYIVDNAGDQVIETAGGGNDLVAARSSYLLNAGAEVEILSTTNGGGNATTALTGNEFGQTIIGNAGDNFLYGGGGADTLDGGAGDDVIIADADDLVVEAAGGGNDLVASSTSYALSAGAEVETLSTVNSGNNAALNLTGNQSGQLIIGNAGANVLDGGLGADTLQGLGGADTFAFTTALGGGNVDAILDFAAGSDRIALDDAVFTAIGGPGALNAGAFVTGTAAADANDRIIYNGANGQLFYDADGNGAGAAVLFATLQGAPILSASDFMVI